MAIFPYFFGVQSKLPYKIGIKHELTHKNWHNLASQKYHHFDRKDQHISCKCDQLTTTNNLGTMLWSVMTQWCYCNCDGTVMSPCHCDVTVMDRNDKLFYKWMGWSRISSIIFNCTDVYSCWNNWIYYKKKLDFKNN